MNALMRLNQLKPGLQYKLVSQTGPVHVPVFTMSVEVDGTVFEASGPSKRTAKLHVAVKVRAAFPQLLLFTQCSVKNIKLFAFSYCVYIVYSYCTNSFVMYISYPRITKTQNF